MPLTVAQFAARCNVSPQRVRQWIEAGRIRPVSTARPLLIDGRTRRPKPLPQPPGQGGVRRNLRGQTFGRLRVVRSASSTHWLCRCDCGRTACVRAGNLVSGKTRSCGCLRYEGRTVRQIVHRGRRATIRQWAESLGLTVTALHYRLRHWPHAEALATAKHGLRHKSRGQTPQLAD